MRNVLLILFTVGLAMMVQGCSWFTPKKAPLVAHQPTTELITVHYTVADHLHAAMCILDVCEYPMLMSAFVSLDDLDQSSPLGRIIPQQIGSRLVQHGMRVMDVRLRTQTLLIRKEEGEFALSRELAIINRDIDAYSVLTGTYTVVYGRVYVTAMILRSFDGAVLASQDYVLPMDRKALQDHRPQHPDPVSGKGGHHLPDPHQGTIVPSVMTRL